MIIIVMVVASLLGEIGLMFAGIFLLFILIPSFAIGIRRLHDTDKSGWWLLIGIIPLASLVLFIFFCLRGTTGPNRFGDDPYGGVPADIFS